MFNVITPLSRYENLKYLIDFLEPLGITWHVITDSDVKFKVSFDQDWIKHYICPNKEVHFWERCNHAINWFLDLGVVQNNLMYCMLNDDDAYEPDFFKKIAKAKEIAEQSKTNTDVIICSMERGHKIPSTEVHPRMHPTTKLWAYPENMAIGSVGVEQIILSGEVISKYRLPLEPEGDGMFILEVLKHHPHIYVPQANVWFNYFEPERWVK